MKAAKPYIPPHMRSKYKFIYIGGEWHLIFKHKSLTGSVL